MKKLILYMGLTLFIALLCTCCIYSNNMIDGLISAKIFWFTLICGIISFFIAILHIQGSIILKFNRLDIALTFFLAYLFVNSVFHDSSPLSKENIEIFGFFVVYLFVKRIFSEEKFPSSLFAILLFLLILSQIIIAVLQWFEVIPSLNFNYKFSGFFFNPAPFVIFLSSMLIYGLISFFYSYNNAIKYLGVIVFILGLPVLIITLSRSAFTGLLTGIIFVFAIKFQLVAKARIHFKRPGKIAIAIILFTAITIFTGYYLYLLKKTSADGRILVWKLSFKILCDNFFIGIGSNKFPVTYLTYQSHYFQQHIDRMLTEGRLADSVFYAFNDILQITVEQGAIGLAFFASLLTFCSKFSTTLLRISLVNNQFIVVGAIASLLIILVSGLFSYPMVTLPVQIFFYSSLAMLSAQYDIIMRKDIHKILMRKPCIWSAVACMFVGLYFISYSIVFLKAYRQGEIIANKGYAYDAMNKLNKFEFVISGEPWYKLRKCDYLLHTGNYGQAIIQLEDAKKVTGTKTIYFSLGSLYEYEKEYNKAEEQYLFLYYALPSSLRPKYSLAKLYYETGQTAKWEKEANEVLNFRVKIPSVETEAMITEIKGLKNNVYRKKITRQN